MKGRTEGVPLPSPLSGESDLLGPRPARVVPAQDPETVALQVKGMTCGGCVLAVRAALNRLDRVEEAEVSMREESAVVAYDPERLTVEEIVAAIEAAGFAATPVETRP